MKTAFSRPLLARALSQSPCFSFSALELDLSNTVQGRIYKKNEAMYGIHFSSMENDVAVAVDQEETMADLAGRLAEEHKLETEGIYSIDLVRISGSARIKDVAERGMYIRLQEDVMVYLSSFYDEKTRREIMPYLHMEDMMKELGSSYTYSKIIANYLQRVDHLNNQTIGTRLFTEDVRDARFDKNQLINNLIEAIPDPNNFTPRNEEEELQRYMALVERLREAEEAFKLFELQAMQKAKLKMSLGLFALLGQFSFVGMGSYVIYSWDIVEPLVYFMNLGASLGLSLYFFKNFDDYSNEGALKYLTKRELNKLTAGSEVSEKEIEQLRIMVNVSKQNLRMSLIKDLQADGKT